MKELLEKAELSNWFKRVSYIYSQWFSSASSLCFVY